MTDKYPDDNPKTMYGDKKLPLHLAPMSAMHAMAEAFADGAKKYGPYNWRDKAVSSTVYYAAALRHLAAWFDGEELAEDSGVPHLSHAIACLGILIDAASIGKLNDNRPTRGASGAVQAAWVNRTPRAAERIEQKPDFLGRVFQTMDSPLPEKLQGYVLPADARLHKTGCVQARSHEGECRVPIPAVAQVPQATYSDSSGSALKRPQFDHTQLSRRPE